MEANGFAHVVTHRAIAEVNVEYAVYKVFWDKDGRRMGSFVNMHASLEEAEVFARERADEHEVVGLMTREITEEDEHLWNTVVFDEEGGFEPVSESDKSGGV